MLKGGVIMDVVTPEQAKIAEDAGAVAVMALERVPADIRAAGGVARMSDPVDDRGDHGRGHDPGHGEGAHRPLRRGAGPRSPRRRLHRRVRGPHARPTSANHIDKHAFKVPFVCGCRNLGEALRRINEGAAMMRTKGEAGTGNIVEAVRQLRDVLAEIRRLQGMREDELFVAAKELAGAVRAGEQVARRRQAARSSTSSPAASPPRPTRRW